MSDALHGHGTTLTFGGTAIGEIVSISGPSLSREAIDVSNLGSANKWKEFIPGMIDAGEISMTINYTETTANVLEGTLTATAASAVIVTFPGSDTFTGSGIVTGLGTSIETEDKISQEVTIKLTGAMVYAIA